ncbi:hypothetical protein [Streptomyces sp. NPDC026673]|uniref:hypothetical protein n=1 Tax=Streptomyces sp. NPDC026673 TaxID=3155724 RepID=UPI0033DF154B
MDVNELVQMVFSGLAPLVMDNVADECERIVVRAQPVQISAGGRRRFRWWGIRRGLRQLG